MQIGGSFLIRCELIARPPALCKSIRAAAIRALKSTSPLTVHNSVQAHTCTFIGADDTRIMVYIYKQKPPKLNKNANTP